MMGKLCNKHINGFTMKTKLEYGLLKQLHSNLTNFQDFDKYFKRASGSERRCEEGYKTRSLEWKRCKDRFSLDLVQSSVYLTYDFGNKTLAPDQFCINFEDQGQLSASICDKDPTMNKYSFYPFILLVSCFFLFLTILIYIVYRKKLLTSFYKKIMLNFTGMMLVSFLTLAINQFKSYDQDAPVLCVFFGFAQQYCFLAAFAFMTVMSCEIMRQIK